MAYKFEADESVGEAVARCAREQLDRAMRELSDQVKNDPVSAVHGARKAVKKQRALLRLARGTLARKQRARENAALRATARSLSGARDAEAMIQTLDQLAERVTGQVPATTFDAVREQLDVTRRSERVRMVTSTLSADPTQELGVTRLRIDDWKFKRDGWPALEPGLLWTYRRGCKAFRQARHEASQGNLHAWRKRVKDLWYQLRLLTPLGGPAVGGQAKEAHQLADLLGDDHDLGVLRQTLVRMSPDLAIDLDALLGLVDYRRRELQTEAMSVGERLYAEKPKAFRRRMHRYWNAGRAEARTSQERRPAALAEVTRAPTARAA